jgi:hypothetical protein
MNLWKTVAVIAGAGAGLAIALVVREKTGSIALVVYVLLLGVALLALLLSRLKGAMRPALEFRRLLRRPGRDRGEVEQFRTIARHLSLSSSNEFSLHYRLRPIVQEIVAARLARRYGVDLEREPDRLRELTGGGRVWELVRPDRKPPEDRAARGWSRRELTLLMDELEDL